MYKCMYVWYPLRPWRSSLKARCRTCSRLMSSGVSRILFIWHAVKVRYTYIYIYIHFIYIYIYICIYIYIYIYIIHIYIISTCFLCIYLCIYIYISGVRGDRPRHLDAPRAHCPRPARLISFDLDVWTCLISLDLDVSLDLVEASQGGGSGLGFRI